LLSNGDEVSTTVTVSFRNFWPGFRPELFLLPLLRSSAPEVNFTIKSRGSVDLEVVSVFPTRSDEFRHKLGRLRNRNSIPLSISGIEPDKRARFSIWFTGENIRPVANVWDLCLSFDPDSKLVKNIYFPLWWQLFPELLGAEFAAQSGIVEISKSWPLADFVNPRELDSSDGKKFACAIISNPEPMRMNAIRALEGIDRVDIFGRITGNPVVDKASVMRDYKFAICFENDLYPGYVTEKLFDAWGSGCVPIWAGIDSHGFINPKAVVNYATLSSMEHLVSRVEHLHRNKDEYSDTASEPLLNNLPDVCLMQHEIFDLIQKISSR